MLSGELDHLFIACKHDLLLDPLFYFISQIVCLLPQVDLHFVVGLALDMIVELLKQRNRFFEGPLVDSNLDALYQELAFFWEVSCIAL